MQFPGRAAKTAVEIKKSPVKGLVSGVLVGYAITCICFIAYSLLITYTSLGEEHTAMVVTLTTLFSVLVAGFDAARAAETRGWLWGIAAGLVYAVILLALGGLFIPGAGISGKTISILAMSLAGGGLGGVIGINVKRK